MSTIQPLNITIGGFDNMLRPCFFISTLPIQASPHMLDALFHVMV